MIHEFLLVRLEPRSPRKKSEAFNRCRLATLPTEFSLRCFRLRERRIREEDGLQRFRVFP